MVPGSTLMYGSNFWIVTLRPRSTRSLPNEAAAMPLPRDETTPPVTKMYFVLLIGPPIPRKLPLIHADYFDARLSSGTLVGGMVLFETRALARFRSSSLSML